MPASHQTTPPSWKFQDNRKPKMRGRCTSPLGFFALYSKQSAKSDFSQLSVADAPVKKITGI